MTFKDQTLSKYIKIYSDKKNNGVSIETSFVLWKEIILQ